MVTIRDVAERAGVATSTVSRAISGKSVVNTETKQRILLAIQELNYQPNAFAKGLKEGKSNTVGLIVPNIRDLVFPGAIKGISDLLEEHGYTLILCNTDEDVESEKKHVNNLNKRLVDGFIFSTATDQSKHIWELKEKGFPIVLLFRHLGEGIDSVIVDNYKGGYEATKFLLNQGLKKIAIIIGDTRLDLYVQRFNGYKQALEEAGIPLNEELITSSTKSWEGSYEATVKMIKRGIRPDAIFATSDPKALGVVRALKDLNIRVPQDISVIGFDNLEVTEMMDPPLTTVAQPFYQAGYQAAKRLVKLMNKNIALEPEVLKLEPELLVRKSVQLKS